MEEEEEEAWYRGFPPTPFKNYSGEGWLIPSGTALP